MVAAIVCVTASRLLDLQGFAGIGMIGLGVGVIYGALMWPLALEAPLGPYVRTGIATAAAFFGVRREALPESRSDLIDGASERTRASLASGAGRRVPASEPVGGLRGATPPG
jgi:hypothetical protein